MMMMTTTIGHQGGDDAADAVPSRPPYGGVTDLWPAYMCDEVPASIEVGRGMVVTPRDCARELRDQRARGALGCVPAAAERWSTVWCAPRLLLQ